MMRVNLMCSVAGDCVLCASTQGAGWNASSYGVPHQTATCRQTRAPACSPPMRLVGARRRAQCARAQLAESWAECRAALSRAAVPAAIPPARSAGWSSQCRLVRSERDVPPSVAPATVPDSHRPSRRARLIRKMNARAQQPPSVRIRSDDHLSAACVQVGARPHAKPPSLGGCLRARVRHARAGVH